MTRNDSGPGVAVPEPATTITAAAKLQDHRQGTGPAGVVRLDDARVRRAQRLALDLLDALGLCACWTAPRLCPSRRRWSA